MRLRLACVSFLNALPFVVGFRRLPETERPEIVLDAPFRCADRLRDGDVEVALVPSIEFARIPNAVEAGPFGIASRHEVRSVVLLSRSPFEHIRSVAADENSRTSVALLKILLARTHGARPEILPMKPEPEAMLARCSAALLIGDPALRAGREGLHVLDLAAAWHTMTGLPFVFALWAARAPADAERGAAVVGRALEEGLRSLTVDAGAAALDAGLPAGVVIDYLTRNIHFTLGAEERRGLELFLKLCGEEGFV